MRLIHDYLQLRKSFLHVLDGQAFQITVTDLANTLFCSPRNAKIILKKMMGLNWVEFVSGRGRGHTSVLTFLQNKDELLMKSAQELVKKGEVESAINLIQDFNDGSMVKNHFIDWMSKYFGYHVESGTENFVETLKLPIYRSINTLDPCLAYYAFDSHMVKQIFNTLVEFDYETNQIVQSISHHWDSNLEKTEWTFYLRKGVYFHHSRELEANDVLFSLNRLKESNHPQNWVTKNIETIEILSKYAVKICLKKPNQMFLLFMSYAPTSIVPYDLYHQLTDTEPILPVGTGPYQVTKRTHGLCVLEAFNHYFQGRAFIDKVEIIIVPETNDEFVSDSITDFLMLRTGENRIDASDEWKESVKISGTSLLTINFKKRGVLQNLQFRKALYYLIDRQKMCDNLGDTRIVPSNGFQFMNRSLGMDNEKDFNPVLGIKMLNASGYKGETIQLFTYQRHATDAYWLQSEYEKCGISIHVNIVSWNDMLKKENIELADLILFEAVLSEGLIRQIEYFSSTNSFINMHLSDELSKFINRHIEDLLQNTNSETQKQHLHLIDQALKENYALIHLVYRSVSTVSHSSLQNVQIHPRGWVDFKNIWFRAN